MTSLHAARSGNYTCQSPTALARLKPVAPPVAGQSSPPTPLAVRRSLVRLASILVLLCVFAVLGTPTAQATSLMENLGRGVVAVRTSDTDVYVSWRMLGTDPADVSFNLYRATGGGAAVRLNASPLTGATIFTDSGADLSQANSYFARPVISGTEQAASTPFVVPAASPVLGYLRIPLQRPAGGTSPDNVAFTYSPNDCSVGDLDGDGEYEIIVKWDPSNSKDNSQAGYTGNVLLDAYKLDGTLLWRIDLGRNIRAGAHYTQFLVYDFDGDGKAEIVCKTAPNTKDGTGAYIGVHFLGTPSAAIDPNADYRNSDGYILTGPEFFTVFNGQTGAELVTTNYVVPRNSNPASSDVTAWGDDYGNRVDRFLACVAYLDGQRPSLVLCRGYYTRAVLAAWDWRDGQLTQRWVADTGNTGTVSPLANWRGQGSHALTVGDVDGDGRDEITYGAAAFDDDGTGLYSTLLGHGDALHMSKMDPNRPGLQVWMAHEDPGSYGANGMDFRDAKTGAVIFGVSGQGADIGRAACGDIDPRYVGYEMWGARGGLMAVDGTQISTARPGQMNFMVWWDGDLLRELLDGTTISKWDWNTSTASPILSPSGVSSNNSTKATPNLCADILGDWREEVIWRESTNDALRIYTTTIPTTHRLPTLMHDRQYRLAIAWQNVGYNQPPHPSFYLGEGMITPPAPDIVTSLSALPAVVPAVSSINRYDPFSSSTGATSVVFRVTFNVAVTGVDAADFAVTTTGTVVGTVSNVTALSAFDYNVTVGSITGTGTIRLDLKATGTGITGPGGAVIASGFTDGPTYNRATLAWTKHDTGGLWSDAANWDGGVIADAIGAVPIFGNFDLLANNTVLLDSNRAVSGLTFGDTDTASAASWIIDNNGNAGNVLTLDTTSGSPTVTVNALGAGATATLHAVTAGSDGLTKAGAGTLVLTSPSSLTGALNVTNGTLRLDPGASLAMGSTGPSITTSNGAMLLVNGGDYTTTGLMTLGSGSGSSSKYGVFRIDSGTATLNGGVRTNNDSGSTLRVNGGTFTTTDVNIRRNSAGSVDFTSGFIVTGGNATVGTIEIGNSNSNGAMSVEGGNLVVTGAVTVGNNSGSTRGGGLRVTGGQFTSTDTTAGVVLTRASGNPSSATFSGGVSTVEKFTLGYNSAVTAGSATLTVGGGTLYLGSGGLVKNGASGFTTTINLSSGVVGAKADWSTALALNLPAGGNVVFQAADAAEVPFNITLNGVLGGAGGFTKTGGGTLILDGTSPHTYAGATVVNGGTLRITSGLAASTSGITVNATGILSGNSALNRDIMLNDGGAVAPGAAIPIATLTGTNLTWNGGGTLAFDVDATGSSDALAISGSLTRGTAGSYAFAFTPGAGFAAGNTYTLATFGSTTFTDVSAFTATGLPAGTGALFQLTGTALQLRIQKTPSIISPPIPSGTYGVPFNYTVVADDTPVSFSLSPLPPGLTFDGATGVLSGTPTAAGSFECVLSARNTAGSVSTPVTLLIAKANAPVVVGSSPSTPILRYYTGDPIAAPATTSPSGLGVTFTYNGVGSTPTTPGTYNVVATVDDPNYQGTASGTLVIVTTALVRHGLALSGDIDGSVQVLAGETSVLNSNAGITSDLLVPGTPRILLNGRPTYGGTVDATGAEAPGNYFVILNSTVLLRHVVRRVDPIAIPTVATPPFPAGTRDVVINSATQTPGDFATLRSLTLNRNAPHVVVPAGTYGTFIANSGTGFVLGVAGATEPAVYNLQGLVLNNGATVQVVGPVVLTLAYGTALNSAAVGDAEHPEWLVLRVANGGVILNSGATLNAIVTAPTGSIIINTGTLNGRITADSLMINSHGLLNQSAQP